MLSATGTPGSLTMPHSMASISGKSLAVQGNSTGVDPFACNQVRLLLAGFGYQIMHVQCALLERMTGTGWSLRRLAERVLRTLARFTVSGRRITMTTGGASAHWRMLARGLATPRQAQRCVRLDHPHPLRPAQRLNPRREIPLHRQLSDLGVQVVDLRLMLLGELPAPALGEHLRHGVEQLPLPGAYLVRMKFKARRKAVEKWSSTPSPNPRYQGVTPAMVGRALLGHQPVTPPEKVPEDPPAVKTGM